MPYEIVKRKGQFVVKKKNGFKVFGRHNTREDAEKQIAAIEANENGGTE